MFLSVMHDRMVPSYIRKTIDAIEVNVPANYVVQAAQRLFASDNRSAGSGPAGHESDDFKEDNWRIQGSTDQEENERLQKIKDEEEIKRKEKEDKLDAKEDAKDAK